ncbi:D-alanyl-D-alanine carboxypeptidase family protein [Marinivivus vitaminiproducens]|uniref:D-alanyl-D-alanine carboxypeptidase family protein n=1 Tax=Marinivivus vitaminiproducens TaxID=3035935 RepID=UPI0027A63297|nr:D-alanyl-D-alanine carboxypeptidase [Geminicoccaceae bacterium SCSIO 64248]
MQRVRSTRAIPGHAASSPFRPLHLVLAFALAILTINPAQAAKAPYAAIVVDAATGEVLHGRSMDAARYPASLTKMMTAYMVFRAIERGKLSWQQRIPVSRHAASMPPSRLGLKTGQRIRVRDAVMTILTKSANDAAVVLAEAVSGTEYAFARAMTERARALGMKRTTFKNASGLPNAGQKTTARDLAVLARALLRDYPKEYALFSTRQFTYSGSVFQNHNGLLGRVDGVDGIKTGYIRASGFNLAASAERDGRRVIAIMLGGETAKKRDARVEDLLALGFDRLPPMLMVGPADPNPLRDPDTDTIAIASADAASGPQLHARSLAPAGPVPLPRAKPLIALAPPVLKASTDISAQPEAGPPQASRREVTPPTADDSVALDDGAIDQALSELATLPDSFDPARLRAGASPGVSNGLLDLPGL